MKFVGKSVKEFYCAFCRTPRSINMQKHVRLFEFTIALAASLLMMLFFFQKFDPRVFVFFGIFISIFEFLIQFKYRLAMTCTECGFDPLLYMKSPAKACEQVKAQLEKRKNDPAVYLSSRPKLDLPVIKKSKDSMGREKRVVTRSHVAKNLDLKL